MAFCHWNPKAFPRPLTDIPSPSSTTQSLHYPNSYGWSCERKGAILKYHQNIFCEAELISPKTLNVERFSDNALSIHNYVTGFFTVVTFSHQVICSLYQPFECPDTWLCYIWSAHEEITPQEMPSNLTVIFTGFSSLLVARQVLRRRVVMYVDVFRDGALRFRSLLVSQILVPQSWVPKYIMSPKETHWFHPPWRWR